MHKPSSLLLTIFAVGFLWLAPGNGYAAADAPASDIITSKSPVAGTHKVSVLFFGNSYTYVNDLPQMVADIASSDPSAPIVFEIKSVTEGGAHLIDLWKNNAAAVIQSRHWDYVVLQNQSEWALFPDTIKKAYNAGAKFGDAIRQAGAVPVLYLTWMRQPGSTWYTDPHTSFMKDPDYMYAQLHYNTAMLAKAMHAAVVPVGDVWATALRNNSELHLYQDDGSHPSEAGTYLAALLFYHYLSGHSVGNVAYQPAGVDATEAAYIKQTVKTIADHSRLVAAP